MYLLGVLLTGDDVSLAIFNRGGSLMSWDAILLVLNIVRLKVEVLAVIGTLSCGSMVVVGLVVVLVDSLSVVDLLGSYSWLLLTDLLVGSLDSVGCWVRVGLLLVIVELSLGGATGVVWAVVDIGDVGRIITGCVDVVVFLDVVAFHLELLDDCFDIVISHGELLLNLLSPELVLHDSLLS